MLQLIDEDFKNIIGSIKKEIKITQVKTIQRVNNNLIMLYFKIGKILEENSKYGNSFIKWVSLEIKLEYPNMKGFSYRNLMRMRRFYVDYKQDSNLPQLVANLPCGHNMLLIERIKDMDTRKKYIDATIKNGWSRNVLAFQIDTEYHKRIGNTINNFKHTLSSVDSDLVNNTLKDPYVFEFLSLSDDFKERELENGMINRIKDVLLELGNGFSFVGNQYKISIGKDEYFLDLLFYHLKLRCYIVVELKTTEFIPEYAGKMNFYLSAVDDMLKGDNDNPSIGLILCKEKNKFTAQYSLKDINKPIGVSSFKITKEIPKELINELPTEEDLNLHINTIGK